MSEHTDATEDRPGDDDERSREDLDDLGDGDGSGEDAEPQALGQDVVRRAD